MATSCPRCRNEMPKAEPYRHAWCPACRIVHARWQREQYATLRRYQRCGRCGVKKGAAYACCADCRAYYALAARAARARKRGSRDVPKEGSPRPRKETTHVNPQPQVR